MGVNLCAISFFARRNLPLLSVPIERFIFRQKDDWSVPRPRWFCPHHQGRGEMVRNLLPYTQWGQSILGFFWIFNFLQFAIDGKNNSKTEVEKVFFFYIFMSSYAEMSF
jgi:hypothetical protein